MGYPDSLKPWTYSLPHTAWLLKALRNVYAPSCSSCESCVAQKQSLVWLRPLSVGSQAPDCGTVDHSQAQALLRLSRASEPGSHTGNPPAPLHWLTNGLCENVATDVMSVHQAHVLPCRHVCCHAGTCVAMQARVLPCRHVCCHAGTCVAMQARVLPCRHMCCHGPRAGFVMPHEAYSKDRLRKPDATLGNRGGPVPLQARHCSTSTCATHTAPGIPFLRRIRQSGGNLRLLHRTVPSGCCLTAAWQSTLEVLGPGY